MGNCAGQLKRSRKSRRLKRKNNNDEIDSVSKRSNVTNECSSRCERTQSCHVSTVSNQIAAYHDSPPVKSVASVEDNESGFYDDSERAKNKMIRKTSYSPYTDAYNDDSSESWNDLTKQKSISETSFSVCLKQHMNEMLNSDIWHQTDTSNKACECSNGGKGVNGEASTFANLRLLANYKPFLEPKHVSFLRSILQNATVIKIINLHSVVPAQYRCTDLTSETELSLIVSGIFLNRCTNGFDKGTFLIRCGGDLKMILKLNDLEKENLLDFNAIGIACNPKQELSADFVQNELNHFLVANFVSEVIQNFFAQDNSEIKFVLQMKSEDVEVPSSDIVIFRILLNASSSTVSQASVRSNAIKFGFPLSVWPENFCAEYFTRERIWPSNDVIKCVRCNGALVSLNKTKDKDYEWSFSFLLAESLLVQALTNKQVMLYVNIKYFVTHCNAHIPNFILKHSFFRFCESYKLHAKDNVLTVTKSFFTYLMKSLKTGEIVHYFNSSSNVLLLLSPFSRVELLKKVEYILTYISTLDYVEVKKNLRNYVLYEKLDYIVEFHKALREQVLSRSIHCINANIIRSINELLKIRTDFALKLEINDEEMFETLEQSASIVQSYINQMRSKQIPVLYHCLWSSYIHFVYPFISKIWTLP